MGQRPQPGLMPILFPLLVPSPRARQGQDSGQALHLLSRTNHPLLGEEDGPTWGKSSERPRAVQEKTGPCARFCGVLELGVRHPKLRPRAVTERCPASRASGKSLCGGRSRTCASGGSCGRRRCPGKAPANHLDQPSPTGCHHPMRKPVLERVCMGRQAFQVGSCTFFKAG